MKAYIYAKENIAPFYYERHISRSLLLWSNSIKNKKRLLSNLLLHRNYNTLQCLLTSLTNKALKTIMCKKSLRKPLIMLSFAWILKCIQCFYYWKIGATHCNSLTINTLHQPIINLHHTSISSFNNYFDQLTKGANYRESTHDMKMLHTPHKNIQQTPFFNLKAIESAIKYSNHKRSYLKWYIHMVVKNHMWEWLIRSFYRKCQLVKCFSALAKKNRRSTKLKIGTCFLYSKKCRALALKCLMSLKRYTEARRKIMKSACSACHHHN